MFVTFEGTEGSGKTTQIRLLAEALREAGFTVTLTKEPGGCPISDHIRSILLDADNRSMIPVTELLLYAAARAQHIAEVIRPALAAGHIVLCDRFSDSTYAYQVSGRGLSEDLAQQLNQIATDGLKPDLTLWFDLPVEVGLGRALARMDGDTKEARFELEALAFHCRVHSGFKKLAATEARFTTINANRPVENIHQDVLDRVLQKITERKEMPNG